MQLGNGKWESTQFNSRLQPTQIALGTVQNGTDKLKLNYDYGATNNNGNVLSQQITVPTTGNAAGFLATQNYSYDSLNRLKSAQETIGGAQSWKQTFIYDRYGNRNFDTANTTTLGGCPANQCNPTIDAANNRFTTGQGYTYDLAGNVITDAQGRTFNYDGENKQKSVSNSGTSIGTYFYDGDGKRVKKYIPSTGETTIFVYDASGKMVAEYATTLSPTPQVSYLTSDNLGTPRISTDANGNVIARHDYLPFGEEIDSTVTAVRNVNLNYGDDGIKKKFTAYERDNESDLDFAEARYFRFEQGRFQSPDPLMASATIGDPQTFNRYAYVSNNPLNFSDPTGMLKESGKKDDPCPDGKICDENGKVVTFDANGNIVAGSLGVVTSLPAAPSAVPPSTIPGNTPIIEPGWWEMLWHNVKKTPSVIGRNAGKIGSFLGRGISVIGIILTNPLPNPGCDFGTYNSETGVCEGGSSRPEIDTSANPNPADNMPNTDTSTTQSPNLSNQDDKDDKPKEHTKNKRKSTRDKHTKPRPGRPTTKDREKWDIVWRPKKKG